MWGYTAVFPVISALVWLGTLLGLFLNWELTGHPVYPSMDPGQTIAFISDAGAYKLKPLFIAGSCVTVAFLDLGFLSERWLRHTGRLAPNTSLAQKILSGLAIFFAVAGSAGLILLSVFDTYRHPHLHDGFLVLFIGGFVLSAIFICAEYQRLGIHYRHHRILRISFWVKLAFILTEIALAIVFITTSSTSKRNIAAIFEWIVALVFTFYVISFVLDLLPSVRTSRHVPQGIKELEMAHGIEAGDSAGPNAETTHGYRGTNMERGNNGYPAGHTDLGRQKRGFGRKFF